MIGHEYKQISTTGLRTKIAGEMEISWREETPAKLARAECEQKKITTVSITSSPRKIKHVRFYQHSETIPHNRSC
jgi:hypothetical protein